MGLGLKVFDDRGTGAVFARPLAADLVQGFGVGRGPVGAAVVAGFAVVFGRHGLGLLLGCRETVTASEWFGAWQAPGSYLLHVEQVAKPAVVGISKRATNCCD